jgi:hypothetical protein
LNRTTAPHDVTEDAIPRYASLFARGPHRSLVVSWQGLEIEAATGTAAFMLGRRPRDLIGRSIGEAMPEPRARFLRELLEEAKRERHAASATWSGPPDHLPSRVAVLPVTELTPACLLVHFSGPDDPFPVEPQFGYPEVDVPYSLRVLDLLPLGLAVCDDKGTVRYANPALADLLGDSVGTFHTDTLASCLGVSDLSPADHTVLRSSAPAGAARPHWVEVTSHALWKGDDAWFVVFVRPDDADTDESGDVPHLARTLAGLGSLVGREPVRAVSDRALEVIERHFIHSALAATRGNRTAAAKMLGLSRQALYSKLHRHGISPTAHDPE